MSEKSASISPIRKPDRRVARTRDRLGDSLIELILAKPFDEITVQEVLDRARVSRSTFYEHYRDKNDLFLSDVDDFFEKMSSLLARSHDLSGRVAPVAEFFSHVADARAFYAALVESGRIHDVRELGEAHFARGIAERLARPGVSESTSGEARQALAQALAGAVFALLSSWLQQGMKATPAQMDQLFHRMIPAEFAARRPASIPSRAPR
jgi:AcrR family transcriptional regulator